MIRVPELIVPKRRELVLPPSVRAPVWRRKRQEPFQAQLIVSSLTNGGTITDATSFNTASISPAVHDLIVIAVLGGPVTPATAPAPTSITGAGLTFSLVTQGEQTANTSNHSLWVAEATAAGSGALTISYSTSQTACMWQILRITGQARGNNGQTCILQTVTGYLGGNGTADSLTMAALGSSNNWTLASFAGLNLASSTTPTATAGNSFIEAVDSGVSDGVAVAFAETFIYRSDTNPAVTWSLAVDQSAIGLEIQAAVTPPLRPQGVL